MKHLIIWIAALSYLASPYLAGGENVPRKTSEWSKEDTVALVEAKSAQYGVSKAVMLGVIGCETGHQIASTTIQSGYMDHGKREESYGLAQINLPRNPNVSFEQATDPKFAVDFLAKNLKAHRGYLWTCHRILYN